MNKRRLRVQIHGAVQGVGFRPFVYRLADELRLSGWVLNSARGVFIEVEGEQAKLEAFLARIASEKPRHAVIQTLEHAYLEPAGFTAFEIRKSQDLGQKSALVLPDIATCDACLREVLDPRNRRYRYPFTNCTDCGPRFTIIEKLPYDRPHTTMRRFPMCARCAAEYENPLNRRFHAQPNACSECGPQLALWDRSGKVLAERDDALKRAADAVRSGKILALKGLGGFQLIVDARNETAVQALRARKARDEKPFAMMYPTLESVQAKCAVSSLEASLLTSAQAPIVLLAHRDAAEVAPSVAPRNPYWGIMLPYTPLHHLLMHDLGFPIVATSGNRSEEPICTDERQVLEQLGDIADVFLVHNRPIARHADDSVARVIAGKPCLLRRARGYAPLPIVLRGKSPAPALAVGAHLKNTVALRLGRNAFLSQHLGDLENLATLRAFEKAIADLQRLYDVQPQAVACDAHPDYASTQHATSLGLSLKRVQHHHAHVLSCMAEHGLEGPALGIAWDGTGYGPDSTVWGGEFLRVEGSAFERVAHLRPFRLPGGEAAVREPRRCALGLLHEMGDGDAFLDRLGFAPQALKVLKTMLVEGLNAPRTSSAGRLFDAVSALLGLCQRTSFEGQAAMLLEFAAMEERSEVQPYEIMLDEAGEALLDWAPMVGAILQDVETHKPIPWISKRFHHTLVEGMLAVAQRASEKRVALSGGCFQNRLLAERAIQRLSQAGFEVYWHQQVPSNDGGIALGQLAALDAQKG